MEMIDITYPCSGSSNWIASDDTRGGTPGTANSVAANNPDLTGPQLNSAFAESPEKVRLYFNEPLASNSDITGSYQLDREVNVQAGMMEGLQ